jgi:hypothetical protein
LALTTAEYFAYQLEKHVLVVMTDMSRWVRVGSSLTLVTPTLCERSPLRERKCPAVEVTRVISTPTCPRYTNVPAEWRVATVPSLRYQF